MGKQQSQSMHSVSINTKPTSSKQNALHIDNIHKIMSAQSQSHQIMNNSNDDAFDYQNMRKIMNQQSKSMQNVSTNNRKVSDLFIQRDIKQTARLLYDLVEKSDRKYRHHTYTQCWIGKDAISAMMEHNLCLHRKHGVELCRKMEELNLIHHVLYEDGGKFGDNKHSFYQFTIDDQKNSHRKRIFSDLDVEFGLIHKIKTKDLLKYTTKNQKSKRVLDQFLQKDEKGILPKFTKLPSAMLQEMDFVDLKKRKHRKKSASGLKSWQKRYVIVRRTHMLWAKTMIDTQNPLDPNERKKFNNSMTLLTIKEVRPVNSSRKRKFDIITPAKTYHFKCSTAEQRDSWLNGLDAHMNALLDSMRFLRQSFAFNGLDKE